MEWPGPPWGRLRKAKKSIILVGLQKTLILWATNPSPAMACHGGSALDSQLTSAAKAGINATKTSFISLFLGGKRRF
jgi:hypothetical protein